MEECMLTALREAEGAPRPLTQAQRLNDHPQPPAAWSPSSGLSGRPTCRIYALDRTWILQLDKNSAWIPNAIGPGTFRTFKTLGAAIRFADRYGLDYRILPGRPFLITKARMRVAGARHDIQET
jgi:hypothetical protein